MRFDHGYDSEASLRNDMPHFPPFILQVYTEYQVHRFREALGVRSSNEQFYTLKIYQDNSLYGVSPVYLHVPTPE